MESSAKYVQNTDTTCDWLDSDVTCGKQYDDFTRVRYA